MKLTKSKIRFLNENADKFEVLACITNRTGKAPVTNDYGMQNILNLINNTDFMKGLGGREHDRINFDIDKTGGNKSMAIIDMVAVAPNDPAMNCKRFIYLTATENDMYELMGA